MLATSPAHRLRLWVVFLIGFSVIGLEVVSFQALSFVNDYLTATRVIAIALLGIAAGGIVSFPAQRYGLARALEWGLTVLPLSVLATFFVVAQLNAQPVLMMVLMALPYAAASFCLSLLFARLPPHVVYWFDLLGAGLGALAVTWMVPTLREEGSFFLLTALSSLPLFLCAEADVRDGIQARPARATGALFVLGALLLLGLQLSHDSFNLLRIAEVDKELFPRKLFDAVQGQREDKDYQLLYSRGSLIERIDILKLPEKRKLWGSLYNAQLVDYIDNQRVGNGDGWLDNRLPTLLKKGENPDTLLVGPSGQGLCKAVQALGKGHVDAVEINGAIARLMTHELWEASGHAYEGMNLTIGDVRTFLARTPRKYDFITLLNTHRIWSLGHQGPPEYVHTVEAMRDYFTHLKPGGFVLFEERDINERADLGIRRIVHTAKQAMRELGIAHPEQHFVIWELYHGCSKLAMEARPPRCPPGERFTFVMIKRSELSNDEFAKLVSWGDILGARPDKGMGYRGIVWRYLPQQPSTHYWTDVVLASDPYTTPGVDRARHVLDAVYDDKPFPYEVFRAPGAAHGILREVAWLALLMVLAPALVAFLAQKRARTGEGQLVSLLLVPFFAVLGVAYLVLEVVLVQKFGIFLSSPANALAIVLGTMLVASGLGGYRSARAGLRQALVAMLLVGAYAAFVAYGLDAVLASAMRYALVMRVLFAILLIAPGAYVMGFPFPFAMDLAKRELSESHAGLFFAINGAAGAVATPLTLIWSMEHGFRSTALLGGGAYLGCALLLAPLLFTGKSAPRPAQASESA